MKVSPRKKSKWPGNRLGDLEMQILPLVWQHGEATVRDVFKVLYAKRGLAYTTIMTVMNRLAVKGILNQDRSRIPYVYTPALDKKEMVTKLLDQVVDGVLGGQVGLLVSYCLEKGKIERQEVGALRELIGKHQAHDR